MTVGSCYPERLPIDEQAAGAIQEQFSHELGTAYNLRGKGLKAPYPGLVGPGEVRLASER